MGISGDEVLIQQQIPEGQPRVTIESNGEAPRGIEKESWGGKWRDRKDPEYTHVYLDDSYTGNGGFRGNQNSPYSWLTPFKSEPQWITRKDHTEYVNHVKRYIRACVKPIFNAGDVPTVIMRGDSKVENSDLLAWVKNCTGTGTSYRDTQQRAASYVRLSDVCYLIMNKNSKDKPVLYTRIARQVIEEPEVDGVDLVGISFDEGYRGEYYYSNRWYMAGGYCHVQIRRRKSEGEEWEIMEDRNTGVDQMCVYPLLGSDVPAGEYLPKNPEFYNIARLAGAVYDTDSLVRWAHILSAIPMPVMFGDFEAGIGAIQTALNIKSTTDGTFAPKPEYFQPNAENLRELLEYASYVMTYGLFAMMREYGVLTVQSPTSQAQSGESKSYDFWATEQSILNTIDTLKKMDEWVFSMWSKLTGYLSGAELRRVYPNSFTPEVAPTIADLSTVAADLALRSGAPFRKLEGMVLLEEAKRALPDVLTDDAKSALAEEIEMLAELDRKEESDEEDSSGDSSMDNDSDEETQQ